MSELDRILRRPPDPAARARRLLRHALDLIGPPQAADERSFHADIVRLPRQALFGEAERIRSGLLSVAGLNLRHHGLTWGRARLAAIEAALEARRGR
jgi:hypothetical protein